MKEIGLGRKARSLVFRKRMSETINLLEDEIREFLLSNGKDELIIGGFRISVKENGQVEVIELPQIDFEQMELPLRKEVQDETTELNRGVRKAEAIEVG